MTVLQEIVPWANKRPKWQQEALCRIIENGDLLQTDIADLMTLCKIENEAIDPPLNSPIARTLEEHMLSGSSSGSARVTLGSIENVENVNALAAGQSLTFGERGLTIVYGDNAAGKSGYSRILKKVCRARRQSDVLPNVHTGSVVPMKATISFALDGIVQPPVEWRDGGSTPRELTSISVFDTTCASAYVEEKNDVAFRPFGLDLLDKMAKGCEQVKESLVLEIRSLEARQMPFPHLQGNTAVGKLIANLGTENATEQAQALATLSSEEAAQLVQLRKQVIQLKAEDPKKKAAELRRSRTRYQSFLTHIQSTANTLSHDALQKIQKSWQVAKDSTEAARLASSVNFSKEPLPNVGSEAWKLLWDAARKYSEADAYTGEKFPVCKPDAKCVLCQQPLSDSAKERLHRFDEFIRQDIQRKADEANEALQKIGTNLVGLQLQTQQWSDIVEGIASEHPVIGKQIDDFIIATAKRRDDIAAAFFSGDWSTVVPLPISPISGLESLVKGLDERISILEKTDQQSELIRLELELGELEAREKLGAVLSNVLQEILRLKHLTALQNCSSKASTRGITQKSIELTEAVITQPLCDGFRNELTNLRFPRIKVELEKVGGARGALYHQITLKRADGTKISLGKIASEGEHRCLALAAFLTELPIADHKSGIVFDDPVSSLDHINREQIAARLISEAEQRQVIVFTHEMVFVMLLSELAEKASVPWKSQHVCHETNGSGVRYEGLPWAAMNIKQRLGYLNSEWQTLEKAHRTEIRSFYEEKVLRMYRQLREAWERSVEELLLGKIVERFKRGVETQRIKHITDITEEDHKAVDAGMTKCSRFTGHDQAAALQSTIPEPDEVKADILALEQFVEGLRKRRSN